MDPQQIQFIQVSPEALSEMIATRVQAAIPSIIPAELMTLEETAKFLNLSTKTVMAMVNDGKLTARKLGSITRFIKSEVIESLVVVDSKK